jgi:hypothetical protein
MHSVKMYVRDVVSECVHTGQANPMFYQLSYEVNLVRERDISELSLLSFFRFWCYALIYVHTV